MLLLADAFLRRNNIFYEAVFSQPILNVVFLILFRLGSWTELRRSRAGCKWRCARSARCAQRGTLASFACASQRRCAGHRPFLVHGNARCM